MSRKILLSGILLIFLGCNPAKENQKTSSAYFDVKGYFEKEALRLNAVNPLLTKTVAVDNAKETRKIHLKDWSKELSVFSDADINRNAWKGLFLVKSTHEQDTYTSDHEKVPVKTIMVTKRNGQLYGIRMVITYSNVLYTSADTLSYFPDSLYQIKKNQKIRLLEAKNYTITGRFR